MQHNKVTYPLYYTLEKPNIMRNGKIIFLWHLERKFFPCSHNKPKHEVVENSITFPNIAVYLHIKMKSFCNHGIPYVFNVILELRKISSMLTK